MSKEQPATIKLTITNEQRLALSALLRDVKTSGYENAFSARIIRAIKLTEAEEEFLTEREERAAIHNIKSKEPPKDEEEAKARFKTVRDWRREGRDWERATITIDISREAGSFLKKQLAGDLTGRQNEVLAELADQLAE